MYPKIDYYGWIIKIDAPFTSQSPAIQEYVAQSFIQCLQQSPEIEAFHTGWVLEPAKGFYFARMRHEASGVALSWGNINPHILCELSGKACDVLDGCNLLIPLIEQTANECTRIDIAVDILTEVTPEQFSAFRNERKWKHTSYVNSASGSTFYIGSRKGERMARVYRYNKPHPRAAFLRVECEYKGDAGKALAKSVASNPLPAIAAIAHEPFGWCHEVWSDLELQGKKLQYTSFRSTNASTVRWLYGTVASSLRRAIKDGLIDWKEFERLIMRQDDEE